jgi:hypothetical protein
VAKGGKGSDSTLGGGIIGIIILIAIVPKQVWIVLGVTVGVSVLVWLIYKAMTAYEAHRIEAAEQARIREAADAARAKQEREEAVRKAKQRLIETVGEKNARLVDSARSAVARVEASEAARAGWLGEVDFTTDIQAIADKFQKAHALRQVAKDLGALDKPSADDRLILAEANTTVANLESAAIERVELIQKCASEAGLIDESLRTERADAKTAEQRAQLHAKLSAMLYGIEATPDFAPSDSAADAVMSRVQAYQEIKREIMRVRDAG